MNPWGWFWFGSRAVFNLGLEKEEWRKKRKSGVVFDLGLELFFYLGLEKGFGEGRTKEEEGEHEKEEQERNSSV